MSDILSQWRKQKHVGFFEHGNLFAMVGHCPHFIALSDTHMLLTEVDIQALHVWSQMPCNDDKAPLPTASDMTNVRKTPLTLFSYCPACGEPINWRAIKARLRTFEKRNSRKNKPRKEKQS